MFYVLLVLLFANEVPCGLSVYSNKAMEGYPTGYLSDCPKPSHDPIITRKTLKRLTFVFPEEEDTKTGKLIHYTYYEMKQLGTNPKMDYNRKTVVYVGGFLDFPGFLIARFLASAYKKLNYNVLLLDTNYFTTIEYPLAALYMRTVGKHAAEMLSNLTSYGLDPKKVEFVGLSLGGQTVSFIAKHYRQLTGMTISRITALDPAGPCFRNLGPEERLDQSDADFVDTINTNIDGFGMAAPIGHVNFYVNGGEFQPGDVFWMPCNVLCSHIRSYTLWMSALNNQDSFIAMKCSSVQEARSKNCYDKVPEITNVVGPKTDTTKQGIFFLATDNNFPYYLGKKGLKRKNEFFMHLMKNIVDTNDLSM